MAGMELYETEFYSLATGHGLMALCCVLYLAWWCIFFRPRPESPQGLEYAAGVALIVGAAVAGLFGVLRIGGAVSAVPGGVPAAVLWPAAIAAYLVLAVVTLNLFNRPITTELLLIVAWTALEIACVGALFTAEHTGSATVLLVLVIAACIGALVCYMMYYQLTDWAAFFDGCGPLVAIGLYSVVFAVLA